MDDDNSHRDTPLDNSLAVDYSTEDGLDEATAISEAPHNTLADGLIARLLRPCVDRLDVSVHCTRLSQLDLKLQLDSLAAELKSLSLAQHECLFVPSSISSLVDSDETISPLIAVSNQIATNTYVLLDEHANRLSCARAKIAVVGNILESTQERLKVLSHRIGREHNNRRSLLEPQTVSTSVSVEQSKLEDENSDELIFKDSDDDVNENQELPTDEPQAVHCESPEPQQSVFVAKLPTSELPVPS